jgi:hypothetical protein
MNIIIKKLSLVLLLALSFAAAAYSQKTGSLPTEIYVEGGKNHVQGIALDAEAGRMYFSFTTSFIKTDLQGKVLGSIDRIQGHLGAMTFNKKNRKVYASLECKDDAIGTGLSSFAKGRSMFYVAIIDVDKIDRVGMDSEDNEAFRIVCVKDATRDYHLTGFADKDYEHYYGCSGIDGVTIAPKLGKKGGKDYLYVAYGIYGDESRSDNDHQVLLRYDFKTLDKYAAKVKFGDFYAKGPENPLDKYFVFTGNTNWGVQNLAYDKESGMMFLAVYKGNKPVYGNYDLFCFDAAEKPVSGTLAGVLYDRAKHPVVGSREKPVQGYRFKYGSTGLCPVGGGLFYISENGRDKESGRQYCRARLYRWTGEEQGCFVRQ